MSEKIRRIVIDEFERSGLTQTELAAKSGMPQKNISNYLAGKKEIQTDTLDRLLAVFGKELKAVKRQLGE